MGDSEETDNLERFVRLILEIHRMDRNLILIRENERDEAPTFAEKATLDIWWSGQQTNIGLILTLAHLLKRSKAWSDAVIRLKRVVDDPVDGAEISQPIEEHIESQRLDVEVEFVPRNGLGVFELIRASSREASLVFLGLRPPDPEETPETYAGYYRVLHEQTAGLTVAYVLASHQVDFEQVIGLG